MAGDWIKMRVWLSRDPRVIRMADYLSEQRPFMNWLTDPVQQSCKTTAYEHVNRNVIVALCVTGLLVTWGTAREQGDRSGDDLVLGHCDKYTLDAITDIECFGEAMEFVGWIVENENGSLTFPKFFRDNESPDEKHKRQNAERQARYREKQVEESNAKSNVTHNVTVTPREEKRRVNISTDVDMLIARGVSEQVAKDFVKLRKGRRAAITETAIKGIEEEAGKAGLSLDAALSICCSSGWQSFKSSWDWEGKTNANHRHTNADTIAAFTGQRQSAVPEGGSGFVVEGCGTRV